VTEALNEALGEPVIKTLRCRSTPLSISP
jgi:hypothetical protein